MKQVGCIGNCQEFQKTQAVLFRLIKDNFPYASFHVRPPGSQYEPGKKRGIIYCGIAKLQIHHRVFGDALGPQAQGTYIIL